MGSSRVDRNPQYSYVRGRRVFIQHPVLCQPKLRERSVLARDERRQLSLKWRQLVNVVPRSNSSEPPCWNMQSLRKGVPSFTSSIGASNARLTQQVHLVYPNGRYTKPHNSPKKLAHSVRPPTSPVELCPDAPTPNRRRRPRVLGRQRLNFRGASGPGTWLLIDSRAGDPGFYR